MTKTGGDDRMMKLVAVLGAMLIAAAPAHARNGADYHLVPGSFEQGRGPDGNSIFLDAPEGLILVDTGRHPAHRDRLLAYAREAGRPIAAIVNTHWHLDHTTGNGDIRAAFPRAQVYASIAIGGALTGFLARSRAATERQRAAGQIPEANLAEVARAFEVMDHPDMLRPTRPVARSREMRIAGRRLRVNLAPFAATEGDVWLYDPASHLVIAGDLVVSEVPFLDTACPEGWRRALDAIAATPFTTLIPGHGAPMDRAGFLAWRTAFVNFIDCGASARPKDECIAGWRRDAARFIGAGREALIDSMAGYYLDNRLRAAPAERDRYCRTGA
jgi:glyoxylase-like metal-dependent hydrolase (beta-lactamase superfamily II)